MKIRKIDFLAQYRYGKQKNQIFCQQLLSISTSKDFLRAVQLNVSRVSSTKKDHILPSKIDFCLPQNGNSIIFLFFLMIRGIEENSRKC